MIASLLLPLLFGCPPKSAPPVDPPFVIVVPVAPAVRGPGVGPGAWTDPAGVLALDIPQGWSGETGPLAGSLVLTLVHEATGVQIQLWEFAGSGQPGPRPRPGCEWMFSDDGRHRVVPALMPAITATCLGDEASAPIVQGWYGRVRGREVHVEVIYPAGRVIEGRAVAEPLLAGFQVVGSAAATQEQQGR